MVSLGIAVRVLGSGSGVMSKVAVTGLIMIVMAESMKIMSPTLLADRQTPKPCVSGIGECRNPGFVECRVNGDGTQCSTAPLAPQS